MTFSMLCITDNEHELILLILLNTGFKFGAPDKG